MKKISRFLIVLFVLSGMVLGACAGAQAAGGMSKVQAAPSEFTGIIEAIDGNQWVVNGQAIVVDPSVVRDGPFMVGDTVKVEVEVAADGSISVTRVELPTAADNTNSANSNDDLFDDNSNSSSNSNDDDSMDDNSNGSSNSNDDDDSMDDNSNGSNSNDDDDSMDDNSNGSSNSNDDSMDDNSNSSNSNDDSMDDNSNSSNSNDDSSDDNSNSGGSSNDNSNDDNSNDDNSNSGG